MKNRRPLRNFLIFAVSLAFTSGLSAQFKEDLNEVERKELATYMVELQVLTHKLGLSVDAKNKPLIEFYLHESLVKIEEIQKELPEYEGTPVGLYIDRMSHPVYEAFDKKVDSGESGDEYFSQLSVAYQALIASCNACHVSSSRDEIVIEHNPFNPYLQDFSPKK